MCKVFAFLIGLSATIVPASARMAAEDAFKMCREHIRQDASTRFGSTNIAFRNTNLNESEEAGDRITGTFLVTGNGSSGIHKFDCSVDVDNANLRWARIDSRNTAASAKPASPATAATPGPAAGAAGDTDAEPMDMCRTAVRSKIYNHGYIRTKFNTISAEKSEGPTYLISGRATGETGGHEAVYAFSCRVNRATGAVESVELNAR